MTRPLELQRTNGTSRTRLLTGMCKLVCSTWHAPYAASLRARRLSPCESAQDTPLGAPHSHEDAATQVRSDSSAGRGNEHASADDTPRELPSGSAGTSVPA